MVVGVRAPAIRDLNDVTRRARETWLRFVPLARTRHRWFVPLHYAAFSGIDTAPYDLVISSSFGFAKSVRPAPGRPHFCYCYSPPRYLWDLAGTYREHSGSVVSAALGVGAPLLRWLDRRGALGVTQFAGISRFVAKRIRVAYNRDARVIYPPVSAKVASKPAGAREGFLLVLGRLVAYKRVDLVIAAAERLGIPLVVAGDGPERSRLERLAGKQTTFRGHVDEATAADLMERCRLFVFCAEEDFGIAPLEANAHGAPVVGYGRGALTETMVPGQTALFFERQTVDDVMRATEAALAHTWNDQALRANATRFAPERFREEIRAAILETVSAGTPRLPR